MMTKEEEAEIYSQRRQKIDCSKVPKRPFFMDEIVKRNRALPAPGQYEVKKALPIKGNVAMKLDRINFLDEAIRNNEESVAPGKYSPKVSYEELTVYRESLRTNGRLLPPDGKHQKSRNGKFKKILMKN